MSGMKAVKDFLGKGQARIVSMSEFAEFWRTLTTEEQVQLKAQVETLTGGS